MKRQILTMATLGGLLAMAAVAVSQEAAVETQEPEVSAEDGFRPRSAGATVEDRPETFESAQSTPAAQPRASTTPRANQPSGPGGYESGVRSSYPADHEFRIRLRSAANDPERRVQELVRDWKAARSDNVRSATEDELRKALGEAFAARMAQHEKQIEELEARVQQLREQLERRREKQDDIIEFRFQELLREAQGLGWGGEPVGRGGNPFVPGGPGTQMPGAAPAQLALPRR